MSEVSREQEPLTISAEYEHEIRTSDDCDPVYRDHLLMELDATREELKKAKDALTEVSKDPGNEAWWSVIKYAYADGGDGARNINSITGHYLAMRRERDESRQQLSQSAESHKRTSQLLAETEEELAKSEKVAEKLAGALNYLEAFPMAIKAHEESREALALYAAHKKDTQPGGGK